MGRLAQKILEAKFDRMRQGQNVGEITSLISDPKIQVALVPLTEAEYAMCMTAMVQADLPETIAGAAARDRISTQNIVFHACRDPKNLQEHVFEDLAEMKEALNAEDINYLQDVYFNVVEQANMPIADLSDEDLEEVKKVLDGIDLRGLSGKQWYELRRFLSSLTDEQLLGNLPGFGSIANSTTTSEEIESTSTVSPDSTETPAKSATSPLQ